MAESQNISISGNENIIAIGTVTINIGQTPGETALAGTGDISNIATISNCYEPLFSYHPRKKVDDEIKRIEKGRPKTLHGTIGTGKTSAALHYIHVNKEKFAVSWYIDVSVGEESIVELLTDLAKKLTKKDVSYRQLFPIIKQLAENKDVIFMLDNVERKPSAEWFKELWNIRHSVHIIITTNNASLSRELPDAQELQVDKFDEALEFLREIYDENSEENLSELCSYFDWNILGLTIAKDYILKNKMTVKMYLNMLSDKVAAETVRQTELSGNERTLYASVRATFEQVDKDKFPALATISFISNKMIPEFFLSSQLSSGSHWGNTASLNDLHDQLKSLVQITARDGARFFSFHSFTQHVLRDMIDESTKDDLMYKLAGIFVRYISKDNRFSKGDFLQRTVREHAEIFLREWESKEKDDRTTIALVRLSELLGFTYTQQQPPLLTKLDVHFERARKLLHKICGITQEDLEPSDGIVDSIVRQLIGLFWRPSLDRRPSLDEMYGITNNHLVVANQLFKKLSLKSSELPSDIVEELVFSRTVNKQDLGIFPQAIQKNEEVVEKMESSQPLSPDEVKLFVKHGAAYSVDAYHKLFLPELYLSIIYSFGRNYFYQNRASMENPSLYTNLLRLAHCLSVEISRNMNVDEGVFHEYLIQSNALLYLLVNDDFHDEDGKYKKKDVRNHARDLKNAIYQYQQLINKNRKFFEMGILKRTESDTYSKLICYQQILKCYDTLLSLPKVEDRDEYINVGIKLCDDLLEILDPYTAQNTDEKKDDRRKEELVRYSRHLNAVGKFYLNVNRDEYYSTAIKIFTNSAEQAEKSDLSYFHLEALVCLADIYCRKGMHRYSNEYLEQCNSKESLREMLRQKPHLQEKIRRIDEQNRAQLQCRQERDPSNAQSPEFTDVSDAPYNASDDEQQPVENDFVSGDAMNEELPLSQCHGNNKNFQPESSPLNSQDSLPDSNVSRGAINEELPLSQGHVNNESFRTSTSLPESQNSLPASNNEAMDTHLTKLAQEIPGKWQLLAKFLHVADSKIDEITLNHPGNVVWQAYSMLKHWWTSCDKSEETWREKLRKGLTNIGRNDLAQSFAGDVLQTDP